MAGDTNDFMVSQMLRRIALKQLDFIELAGLDS
jgi:hypothetical protein